MSTKKLILYDLIPSPACRAVKVLAKALDLELELKTVDLFAMEQYTEEYLKLNPNHTVPTLDDNGTILWDSHAILMYLVDKYAKDDSLYPKDVTQRANINQLLFMDATLFQRLLLLVLLPLYLRKEKVNHKFKIETINDSYTSIERILDSKLYLTGDNVTIADISLITNVTSAELLIPIDEKLFPNIANWKKRLQELPYYEPNDIGVKEHDILLKKYLED